MIEELKKIVAEEKDEIRQRYKAEIKAVFGSYARGDFRADSDLDILVDLDAGADLLHLVGLQHFWRINSDIRWMSCRNAHFVRNYVPPYSTKRYTYEKLPTLSKRHF